MRKESVIAMEKIELSDLSVAGVSPSIIPSIYDVRATSAEGTEVIFEYHEEMGLKYAEGEKLSLKLSPKMVQPADSSSFCGKAVLYSVKQKAGRLIYLFSAWGLILRVASPRQLGGLEIAGEYYFCIEKV